MWKTFNFTNNQNKVQSYKHHFFTSLMVKDFFKLKVVKYVGNSTSIENATWTGNIWEYSVTKWP